MKKKMRDAKRPRVHTSGDRRPIVAIAAVTGQSLRLAASGVGELRMDRDAGTLVGRQGPRNAVPLRISDGRERRLAHQGAHV